MAGPTSGIGETGRAARGSQRSVAIRKGCGTARCHTTADGHPREVVSDEPFRESDEWLVAGVPGMLAPSDEKTPRPPIAVYGGPTRGR